MWLDRYMEIPFKDRGRDFSGADCFGFYLLLLAHEAKIEINDPNVSYGRNPNAVLRAIEAEIASARWKMIAAGESLVNIANTLHLSPNTVTTYRTRILEKMGMASNAELTRYAIENGLLI